MSNIPQESSWYQANNAPYPIDLIERLKKERDDLRARLELLTSPKDHGKCRTSTGIDGALTAGTGELDEHGYFQFPCSECAAKANAVWARHCEQERDSLAKEVERLRERVRELSNEHYESARFKFAIKTARHQCDLYDDLKKDFDLCTTNMQARIDKAQDQRDRLAAMLSNWRNRIAFHAEGSQELHEFLNDIDALLAECKP